MANKKDPIEQKARLVEQLNALEKKIADFDQQRAAKVAGLAKRYRLLDLSDTVLEQEFKQLREKYHKNLDPTSAHLDAGKKKS